MPSIINTNDLEFKVDSNALPVFGLKTLFPRLTNIGNSKHFMFDIRQLDPGKYSFPYHFHRNAEELIMIISGSFTLRSETGFKVIKQGEILFFEMGESSAHQFFNHDTIPCIYLDIRSTIGIDVVEYPDSGKINISPFKEIFMKDSQVEYNTGEDDVQKIWDKLRANL
jgi:uncharacterized cupin superfamily protein